MLVKASQDDPLAGLRMISHAGTDRPRPREAAVGILDDGRKPDPGDAACK